MISPDGINWTTQSTSNNNWFGLVWAPELGLLVAVSGQENIGNLVMTAEVTNINNSLTTADIHQILVSGNPNPKPVNSF